MTLSSHQSAAMKNDEWLTPPEILATCGLAGAFVRLRAAELEAQ